MAVLLGAGEALAVGQDRRNHMRKNITELFVRLLGIWIIVESIRSGLSGIPIAIFQLIHDTNFDSTYLIFYLIILVIIFVIGILIIKYSENIAKMIWIGKREIEAEELNKLEKLDIDLFPSLVSILGLYILATSMGELILRSVDYFNLRPGILADGETFLPQAAQVIFEIIIGLVFFLWPEKISQIKKMKNKQKE
jgi:hypothetical protein